MRQQIIVELIHELPETLIPILGIDPSLVNLGMSFGFGDLETGVFKVTESTTYYLKKMITEGGFGCGVRIREMDKVRWLTRHWVGRLQPEFVVTEKPVVNNLRPNIDAYAKQVEGIASIKFGYFEAILENPLIPCSCSDIIVAHPGDMKQYLGAPRNSGDKELIKKGLSELIKKGTLVFEGVDFNELDEHALDATAMALVKFNHLLEQVY